MFGTLRHAGILVKSLERATKEYQALGFTPLEPIETLRVQKMTDRNGAMIELVEGNWHPHIAVNWYETEGGNYVETVKEAKLQIKCPWGHWESGLWFPNPRLEMSEAEQRRQNIENGYEC